MVCDKRERITSTVKASVAISAGKPTLSANFAVSYRANSKEFENVTVVE